MYGAQQIGSFALNVIADIATRSAGEMWFGIAKAPWVERGFSFVGCWMPTEIGGEPSREKFAAILNERAAGKGLPIVGDDFEIMEREGCSVIGWTCATKEADEFEQLVYDALAEYASRAPTTAYQFQKMGRLQIVDD